MKRVNGRMVGRLGSPELGTTLALRKDGTVQSAIVKSNDAKTLFHAYQRLKLPNLGAFHASAKEALQKAFQSSNINLFAELMRYNAVRSMPSIGITKTQKAEGACILLPYKVSEGSLESIVMNGRETSILLDGLTVIDANTTVGQLADAIVSANPAWKYDDRLTYIECHQTTDATGTPIVNTGYSAVTLAKNSDVKLSTVVNMDAFGCSNGYLATKSSFIGGFCYIHSRKDSDGFLSISSQRMICDNDLFINLYTDSDHMQAAAESYGFKMADAAVVEPTTARQMAMYAVFGLEDPIARRKLAAGRDGILAVEFDGVTYAAGSEPFILTGNEEMKITVTDGSKLASAVSVKVNGQSVSSPTKDGNVIAVTIPSALDGVKIDSIQLSDGSRTWRLEF